MVSAAVAMGRQPQREGNERHDTHPGEAQLPTNHDYACCIRPYVGYELDEDRFRCPMWVWALFRRTDRGEFHDIMSDPEECACAEAIWRLR